jgi:ABC-type multidrug transport system ATPase subunit
MAHTVIELKETSFRAQDKDIVRDISLTIEEGVTTALVGPSGCGKSTVLKLAAGLIVPTAGSVLYRNHNISTMNRIHNLAFRKEAAFVFQDSALWANQTLRQTLELPLKIHFPKMGADERTARIQAVLRDAGYRKEIDIRPSQLSMGEQKLIAFARAWICEPRILFLDEWTESLDDTAARRLITLVKKRQEDGCTIVFVSHNPRIIKDLAQRICMIVDGRLTLAVTAEEYTQNEYLAKTIEKGIAQ